MRFLSTAYSNWLTSKISSSGRKRTRVPVDWDSPTTSTPVTGLPRSYFWRQSLPSRLTVTSRNSDRALTTDTPTPCRPPETL